MPQDGMQWWHIVVSTWKSWLPADKRGFRSRDHKIHSSGDYKNPPPIEEHAGLRNYHQQKSSEPIVIPADLHETAGRAILAKLKKGNYRVLAVSVSATHSHWLVELPSDYEETKQIAGQCKAKSSHAIRDRVPGRVWGSGGSFKRIKDRQHHLNAYHYILDQEDAWIWDFAEEVQQDTEEAQG
jgi:REP element-mobilizing transposase RayT